MPSVNFWDKDEIIVVGPQRNYTVFDYEQLFDDIGYSTGYQYWLNNKDLLKETEPPGIEIHQIYGSHVPTPGVLLYNTRTFPDLPPTVLPDDGDGTVNIRSLKGFQRWQGKQEQAIHSFELTGVEHLAILRHPSTVDYVAQVLMGHFDRK